MTKTNRLKTELFSQIEALGRERSLLPFSEASIDETIGRLENINPIPQPLHPDNFTSLLGDWQLIYASNGTVVTRPISEMTNTFGSAIAVASLTVTLVGTAIVTGLTFPTLSLFCLLVRKPDTGSALLKLYDQPCGYGRRI